MAQAEPKCVYVLYGTDDYLRDSYRAELSAHALAGADSQTCLSRFDSDADLAAVLDDLRTLPFLGDRRLVIVEDADDFVSAHREALEEYLDAPSSTGSLMLLVKSFPSNTRLAKVVAKVGLAVDCNSPKGPEVGNFIRDRAKALGRTLDRSAGELMLQWLGNDLARIQSELEKLALYTQGRTTITANDVSAVVVATAGVNPWALTDALADGDAKTALTVLSGMLTQRGEEFKVLGMVGWHLRRLLKAQHMRASGKTDAQIFAAFRIENWRAKQESLRRAMSRRSLSQVSADFRELIRADLAMKTGGNAEIALQRLIVSLCCASPQ